MRGRDLVRSAAPARGSAAITRRADRDAVAAWRSRPPGRRLADRPLAAVRGEQRLRLAQAIVDEPLLLADEPLSSLDSPPARDRRLIDAQRAGTQLFIAHDVNPILGSVDRILYRARGTASARRTRCCARRC